MKPGALLAIVLALPMCAADVKEELAPSGTLRATFLGNNPVQGRVSASGEVSGPVFDIVQEIARRIGVPFKIIPGDGVRAVIDGVKNHSADIGFLAFDATRAAEVDFSKPYSLAHNTYLVRADSPLQAIAGSDREGIRIAAPKGDSGELFLSRTLKKAQLVSKQGLNIDDAKKMLAASEIDAFATNRQRLTEAVVGDPKYRVLPDNFFAVEQSLVVDKGGAAKIEYLNRLIDDLKASGFLKASFTAAKLNGVDVP
jgi:polar amino acid transport system substrate-binding protein